VRSTQLTTNLTLPISLRGWSDHCFDANQQNLYTYLRTSACICGENRAFCDRPSSIYSAAAPKYLHFDMFFGADLMYNL